MAQERLPHIRRRLMPESKNDFRKALGSVIDVRGREATRQAGHRYEYQLIGAFTKRPN
jgi:hypothetical protein